VVKLRFKRFGRRNRPFYRLNAIDTRRPRNGLPVEELGMYDPLEKELATGFRIKTERVQYWLNVGAQPSETVRSLLKKVGFALPDIRQKHTTKAPPKISKAAKEAAKAAPATPGAAPAAAPAAAAPEAPAAPAAAAPAPEAKA
jgi:small subunit ribosomal protein S16